jgi:flagellar basal-body rod protein FlgC
MDLIDTFNIAGSGLSAQRARLQTITSNLANARTTSTEDGGPYKRRAPVFVAETVDPFGDSLDRALSTVRVDRIEESDSPGRVVYDPTHPDADENGNVTYPDVDVLSEMVDLMTTARSYEANTNALDVTRELAQQALEIGR